MFFVLLIKFMQNAFDVNWPDKINFEKIIFLSIQHINSKIFLISADNQTYVWDKDVFALTYRCMASTI